MAKALKIVSIIGAFVLLASVPRAMYAQTGSEGLPSVHVSLAAGSEDSQVRPGSPISLTATFSKPVFGFDLEDIIVVNGVAGNFVGSGGDAIYTFEVTPNAIGEVTIDIAASSAEDADGNGNGNTAAPRFSLGITYDDDGDSGISKTEAIAAITDYFNGGITKAQAIKVIQLYFASAPVPAIPGNPANQRYSWHGSTTVVSWQPVDVADYYNIYHDDFYGSGCSLPSSGSLSFCEELATNVAGTSYAHSNPDLASNYYWVTACNSSGCSEIDSSNPARLEGTVPTHTLPPLHDTQNTRWLKSRYPALYRQIQALHWVRDGTTEFERKTIDYLLYMGVVDTANLRAALALPWVQDEITEAEYEAIHRIYGLGYTKKELAATVMSLLWVQDGITETESEAIKYLDWLAHSNESAAESIIAMPFLESLEADDVLAIRGIRRLARYADEGRLDALMGHPALSNGITDAHTTLVTAAATLREAGEIRRMLNPGYADIETLSAGTELTPDLTVSIVRAGTQRQSWTASGVRDAVEFAERIMQLPLPVVHVVVVLNELAVSPGAGGTNFGFAIGIRSQLEQGQGAYDRHSFLSVILHETAHYYWRGNADWIDEGISDTFQFIHGVETGLSPGLLERPRRKNCEAHDLEMLTEWKTEQDNQYDFHCNYFLGQMLFLELLENLGNEEFYERLRELYRLSLATKGAGATPGIAEVRQAFHGQAKTVEKHWSGKLNAPENRPFDEGVYRRNHGLVQWDQYPTYDGDSVTFSGALTGGAVLSGETIAQARRGGFQNFTLSSAAGYDYVGAILPPLDGNRRWILDDPGDAVAIEYRIGEGRLTVEFRIPEALGSPSGYVVIVWGFQDESRTPFIGAEIDLLGYARIRSDSTGQSNRHTSAGQATHEAHSPAPVKTKKWRSVEPNPGQ